MKSKNSHKIVPKASVKKQETPKKAVKPQKKAKTSLYAKVKPKKKTKGGSLYPHGLGTEIEPVKQKLQLEPEPEPVVPKAEEPAPVPAAAPEPQKAVVNRCVPPTPQRRKANKQIAFLLGPNRKK